MHAAYDAELATPFAAQAAIAEAISCYRTQFDMSIAHANCLGMLAYTRDPNAQVFLQSCLIALRLKMSFGAFLEPPPVQTHIGIAPCGVLPAEPGGSTKENGPVGEVQRGRLGVAR